jgi:hypothetical protein
MLNLAPFIDSWCIWVFVEDHLAAIGSEDLVYAAFSVDWLNPQHGPIVVSDDHLLARLLDLAKDLQHVSLEFALGYCDHRMTPKTQLDKQHGCSHDYGHMMPYTHKKVNPVFEQRVGMGGRSIRVCNDLRFRRFVL